LSAVHIRPESPKVVRPGGSQRGSQRAMVWLTARLAARDLPGRGWVLFL